MYTTVQKAGWLMNDAAELGFVLLTCWSLWHLNWHGALCCVSGVQMAKAWKVKWCPAGQPWSHEQAREMGRRLGRRLFGNA
jgi:hypothetical protein